MACALADGIDRGGWTKGACHGPLQPLSVTVKSKKLALIADG
jgi:hypothetical protein